MGWKETLCYSEEHCTEYEINGTAQKFYPINVVLVFRLRTAATKLVRAISAILADTKKDFKTYEAVTSKPKGDGTIERILQIDPLSVEMAKYRDEQRAAAWSGAVDALTDEDTQLILAEIVMSSLRDVFKDAKVTPKQFIAETPAPVFAQTVIGAIKANKDVFGPLADKASSLFKQLEGAVTSKLAEPAAAEIEAVPSQN